MNPRAAILTCIAIVLAACSSAPEPPKAPEAKIAEAKTEPVTPPVAATPQLAKPPASVPPSPPEPLVLPAGTRVAVRTASAISTKSAAAGQTFAASLAEPLVVNGRVVAPRGSDATLLVVESDPGGRVKGVAALTVRLAELRAAGRTVRVQSSTYTAQARATKKKDAMKVGIGSGIGAAIGAIAGGGKGAAIGAGAGAGAGTGAVLATRGDPAVIPAEALITFRLGSSVSL